MEREGVAVVFCNSVLLIPGHGAGPCCARHAATISVSLSTSLHRKEEICNIWSSGIFPWLPLAIGISADWAIQKVLGNKSQPLLSAASSGALSTPFGRFHFNWPSGMTYFSALGIFKMSPKELQNISLMRVEEDTCCCCFQWLWKVWKVPVCSCQL